jgi:Na+/melibiose symporter-like transporter
VPGGTISLMESKAGRIAMIAGAIVMVYAVTAIILLKILPGPHRSTDYLVIGAVATFISMGILFWVVIAGVVKTTDNFYKRRKPEEDSQTTEL